jgi:hypothetical protein
MGAHPGVSHTEPVRLKAESVTGPENPPGCVSRRINLGADQRGRGASSPFLEVVPSSWGCGKLCSSMEIHLAG